jgi:hypothetical protein
VPAVTLERLRAADLDAMADVIRGLPNSTASVEEAAQVAARCMFDGLHTEDGGRASLLVRIYKTHRYGALPADLQEFAASLLDEPPADETRCLTLLGTAGVAPAWNHRSESAGHKAIPMPTEDFVERLPMVSQLVTQLGLDLATVVRPTQEMTKLAQQTYGVFHVEEAAGSPYLPAQDFVKEYGVRSAVGFGGVLLSGDFYAAVIFSAVPVTDGVARTLRILALPLRVALTQMVGRPVFAG